jgi:hypothetical protein
MRECTRAIRYDAVTREFVFDHERLSVAKLGAIIANVKLSGEKMVLMHCEHRSYGWTTSYSVNLHIDYLIEMLDFVALHGWFWDEIEEYRSRHESDHEHDPLHITPGLYWAEVQRLRQSAHQLGESSLRHNELGEPAIAGRLVAMSKSQTELADSLLPLSIPDYRKKKRRRRRRRLPDIDI